MATVECMRGHPWYGWRLMLSHQTLSELFLFFFPLLWMGFLKAECDRITQRLSRVNREGLCWCSLQNTRKDWSLEMFFCGIFDISKEATAPQMKYTTLHTTLWLSTSQQKHVTLISDVFGTHHINTWVHMGLILCFVHNASHVSAGTGNRLRKSFLVNLHSSQKFNSFHCCRPTLSWKVVW